MPILAILCFAERLQVAIEHALRSIRTFCWKHAFKPLIILVLYWFSSQELLKTMYELRIFQPLHTPIMLTNNHRIAVTAEKL